MTVFVMVDIDPPVACDPFRFHIFIPLVHPAVWKLLCSLDFMKFNPR